MKQKKILLFSIAKDKRAAIEDLCGNLGWQAVEIPRQRYGEPLGALVGMPVGPAAGGSDGEAGRPGVGPAGAQKTPGKEGRPGVYQAMGFPAEMLVLCGLEDGDLDRFLKAYREAGIAPVPLKAMLTPFNVSWSAEKLFGELMAEHARMGR